MIASTSSSISSYPLLRVPTLADSFFFFFSSFPFLFVFDFEGYYDNYDSVYDDTLHSGVELFFCFEIAWARDLPFVVPSETSRV